MSTPGRPAAQKGSSLGGQFNFDAAPSITDVTGTDLFWFRAPGLATADVTPQLYTAGWPNGIYVQAQGALYNTALKLQASLGLDNAAATTSNAELEFDSAKLQAPYTLARTNLNITGSTITKLAPSDFTLTATPATGSISGTFTPNWSTPAAAQPKFKGIVLQKGTLKGGYGYFITNIKNDLHPESGAVHLGKP